MIRHSSAKTATRTLNGKTKITCGRHQLENGKGQAFSLFITADDVNGVSTSDIRLDSTFEGGGLVTAKYALSREGARVLHSLLGQMLKK